MPNKEICGHYGNFCKTPLNCLSSNIKAISCWLCDFGKAALSCFVSRVSHLICGDNSNIGFVGFRRGKWRVSSKFTEPFLVTSECSINYHCRQRHRHHHILFVVVTIYSIFADSVVL